MLGSLLDQHPSFYWDGEALLPHRKSERWMRSLQGVRGESRIDDLRSLMSFARGRTYVLSAKGSLKYPTFRAMLADLRALGFDRFVVLERKNILCRIVSSEVGHQHRTWHLRTGRKVKLNRIRLPLVFDGGLSLLERLEGIRSWYAAARCELRGCSTLELDYETHILSNPTAAYRAVCGYVGIEPAPVRVRHQRVNPFPLSELVSNYGEIESLLSGTDFEWMLAKERPSG